MKTVQIIIIRYPVTKCWLCSNVLYKMYSYLLAIDFNVSNVVLKHCGHIDLWKLVFTEHNQKTGLPAGSISHYDQLFPYCCHSCRWETEKRQKKKQRLQRALNRNNSGEGHCTAPRHCAMTSTTPVRNYEPAGNLQLCCHSARLWNQHPRLAV